MLKANITPIINGITTKYLTGDQPHLLITIPITGGPIIVPRLKPIFTMAKENPIYSGWETVSVAIVKIQVGDKPVDKPINIIQGAIT